MADKNPSDETIDKEEEEETLLSPPPPSPPTPSCPDDEEDSPSDEHKDPLSSTTTSHPLNLSSLKGACSLLTPIASKPVSDKKESEKQI